MNLSQAINAARSFLDPSDVDLLLYHSPCADGSGAAFSGWMLRGDTITYEPFNRQIFPAVDISNLENKNVVMIDCAFKKDELPKIRTLTNKLLILDHHKSNMNSLENEAGCVFSMQCSGCILAWHYFHGLDSSPPRILTLIEDRDLMRWSEKETSKPIAYALEELGINNDFRKLSAYSNDANLPTLVERGLKIQEETFATIAGLASKARICNLRHPLTGFMYQVACLEMSSYNLTNEVSEYLYNNCSKVDLTMLWHQIENNDFRVSFRTNKDTVDLSELALSLGGAGHSKKSGATINYSPWLLVDTE